MFLYFNIKQGRAKDLHRTREEQAVVSIVVPEQLYVMKQNTNLLSIFPSGERQIYPLLPFSAYAFDISYKNVACNVMLITIDSSCLQL